ncbi:1964_t:CDS:2 [Scutellospora calospora]|uniref:1964_t:CDS:1 n=1 Tax=Scutellospora calospora TaxID=85575 RepID=A0ACA9KKJ5_9GLOM|nr:1964_t:CDS:2 [Scutellospora calospora]
MGDEYSDNKYLDNMYLDDEYNDEYLENEYLEDEYLEDMILECEDTNIERLESNNMDGLNSNEASPQPSISAMIENGRVKIMSNDNDKYKFSIMAESLQPTIKQVFDNIKKYAFNHPKQKKLDNNIAVFIIEDLQLFSVLQLQAFKRIIEGLDIQANVLSIDYLKEIFINSEDKILKKIREYAIDNTEISSISFTTDMWTSDNGDLYIRLTLHWINSNFEIKEIISNISYLLYPHTAKCLSNKIVEILDNLQLKNITVCGTIDNGSNIKLYLEKLERKYSIYKVFCFGYILQFAINDALKKCPKITNLIKKCKDIVSHFSGSPKQKQFLLKVQMEMEDWNKLLTVVHDYKLLLVKTDNNNLLKNYEEKELSLDAWDKVTGLVKLLYPYEVISKKLSGDQLDMTASYDKIDNEDIFAPSATDFQEYSD